MGETAGRLPRDPSPERYDLHLDARLGRETFRGEAVLHLRVGREAPTLTLHAAGLHVTSVAAEAGGRAIAGSVAGVDEKAQTVTLSFASPLPPGETRVRLAWEGRIQTGMRGLYRSTDGAEACLATQCEEADARSIFPCVDEPARKAILSWRVTTDPDVVVLANGALARVERTKEGATWTFQPTPPIPTYLAALALGRLAATPEVRAGATPMRVWAMEGKEPLGRFALDLGARLLPWFEAYFATPYAFGKYDQVAVPSFSAGAMENAGLVIFRASLLLRDPKTTSWRQEKVISRVVAHEMAHMWFGNVVTMEWWDDIWLNESFAEWIALKATHAMEPSYGIWNDAHGDKRRAMESDALLTTHAIYAPVASPHEVTELFDAITYEKGAAVMRMLEAFLGESPFREGLRAYMREFAFANAKGEDLWRHLETASDQPVAKLMSSWILQPGFPVVTARLEGSTIHASQRRFLAGDKDPADPRWLVPLVIRYADDAGSHEARHLMTERDARIPLPAKGRIRYALLNGQSVGFFRQDLDDGLLAALVENVSDLTAPEQMDLLDDAWALAKAGARPAPRALDLLGPILRHAKSHTVLALAAERLRDLEEALRASPPALEGLRALVADALREEAARLGNEARPGEARDDAERRAIVLETLGIVARDPDAIAWARGLAEREERDPASVDATLAAPALRVVARHADELAAKRLIKAYEARRLAGAPPSIADRPLNALPLLGEPALARHVLDAERAGAFPLQAVGPLLRAMLGERPTQEAAFAHLQEHWARLRQGLGDQWIAFLVAACGKLPAARILEMRAFFEANAHAFASQSAARALEESGKRSAWLQRLAVEAEPWLAKPRRG